MERPPEDLEISISADMFDTAVHTGMTEAADLELIVKPDATTGGNPVVCITFTAYTPAGPRRAQAVTTLNLLRRAVEKINDRLE